MTSQRQEIFLRDMLNSSNTDKNASSSDSTSIQLTKILQPFQLYTKKRTDINNNSVEISLLGKTIEHYSLDILTDRSVSVYLAEDGLSNTMATAQTLIKKMLPITFSSVKKNDRVSVISSTGARANPTKTNNLNSNQPPKVAFRVKSHGKGCNGTVKLFVMPFVITEEVTKNEEHYFLMIKAKRNSLGKGNNKYGIENAYMFQKSLDNDLIDQIIDRVQAFDSSTIVTQPTTSKSNESNIEVIEQTLTSPTIRRVSNESVDQISKKKRVRSTSNVTQSESKTKLRKTFTEMGNSVQEESKHMFTVVGAPNKMSQTISQKQNMFQMPNNQHQQQQQIPSISSPSNNNYVNRTTRILSQGTVPLSLDFNQPQRHSFSGISNIQSQQQQQQPSNQPSASQLAMMVMMQQNNQQFSNTNTNNNIWNNQFQNNNNNTQTNAATHMSISSLGAAMKNRLFEYDYQKQFTRQNFQQPQQSQQQNFQPTMQYFQAPSVQQSFNDNRAIKRTMDEIFSEDFNVQAHHQQQTNLNNQFPVHHHHHFTNLPTDDDIMSVQHQEMAEIIDSIQMFDLPLTNNDDEEILTFFSN